MGLTAGVPRAAYAFAQMHFPGRDALFILFLASMMIPGKVTLIPYFVTIRHIPFFGGNDWAGNGGQGMYDNFYFFAQRRFVEGLTASGINW